MTDLLHGLTTSSTASMHVPRCIGVVRSEQPGPTLVIVGGTHGNERAGLTAAERVLASLAKDDASLRGELVVLSGNRGALARGVRYQGRDLNRMWTAAELRAGRDAITPDAEQRELVELHEAVTAAIESARGDAYVMDLHTTSASGIPFVVFSDTLRHRRFAFSFPLPCILGLEDQIDGVMASYFTQRGCVAIGIEGGQHDDPRSVDDLEACLWVALVSAGLVSRTRAPRYDAAYARLDSRRGALPRVMEVMSRHAITAGDGFEMEPGFANLDRARKGQLLARDASGAIRAAERGLVILPLYQGLGTDGFFWGRGVSGLRVALAERVRRAGLEHLLPWLPGVRRDPAHPHRLRANTRIARLYPADVFHIFGYRRIRQDGATLVVERQPD